GGGGGGPGAAGPRIAREEKGGRMPKEIEYLNPDGACPAQGLYSHVTRVPAGASLIFVAGQLAVGADGEIVGKGDFAAQFAQVFKNMAAVLKGLECNFNDVIKFTTYL